MRVLPLIPLLVLVSCVPEPEAEVKDSVQDNPAVFIFERLFEEIIGRKVGNEVVADPSATIMVGDEVRIKDDISLIEKWFELKGERDALSDEDKQAMRDTALRNWFYPSAVNLILNSQQYLDEGFLHLHKRRLLLFHQGNTDFMRNAEADYLSLQAEMHDVAVADNYWQLFNYRQRYLSISSEPTLGINISRACFDTESDPASLVASKECIDFLLASFLPDYHHDGICQEIVVDGTLGVRAYKFSSIYSERCGDGSIEPQDTAFCDTIDAGYQQLLGKNYADIAAEAEADASVCSDNSSSNGEPPEESDSVTVPTQQSPPKDPDPLFAKAGQNFTKLIYFYVSLHLSEGAATVVEAHPPAAGDYVYVPKNTNFIFLKAKLPADLQGIHANLFWLSQHRTTAANMNLHRARLLLYSWFCEYVSPDAASLSGDDNIDADEKQNLLKYFAPGDIHTFSDKNCFDCHRRVQPLGNYFGKLSLGAAYHDEIEFARANYHKRFLEKDNPFDRLAGYYNIFDKDFYGKGKGKGVQALAELLSEHPTVQQCIVTSTWNNIFGSNNPLNSNDIDDAVEVFATKEFSYKELLRHLLLSKKAQTYFLEGQDALSKIIAEEQQNNCEAAKKDKAGNLHGKTAQDIFTTTCSKCHGDGSQQPNSKFMPTGNQFNEEAEKEVYNDVYQRVDWGTQNTKGMPMGGYQTDGFPSAAKQRELLLCFLKEKAKERNIELDPIESAEDSVAAMAQPLSANHTEGVKE